MNKRILDILRAKFLVSETAPRNWRFLIFLALLGALDVTSSHVADWQVHRKEELKEEVQWLKNELVLSRRELQELTLESYLARHFDKQGLHRPDSTVKKLIVNSIDQWQLTSRD